MFPVNLIERLFGKNRINLIVYNQNACLYQGGYHSINNINNKLGVPTTLYYIECYTYNLFADIDMLLVVIPRRLLLISKIKQVQVHIRVYFMQIFNFHVKRVSA